MYLCKVYASESELRVWKATSEGEYYPLKISASPKFPDHEGESIKSNFKPGDALKHLTYCKVTHYVNWKK